jgi:hypothetical protein
MSNWIAKLHMNAEHTKLLIESPNGDLLKARLPRPRHPRALLTLLEGTALWAGTPLCAVTSAEGPLDPGHAATLFGDGAIDSALVRFVAAVPRARARRTRIAGVGDFRQLHLLDPGDAS